MSTTSDVPVIEAEAEPRTAVDSDGWVYDVETGEVVGLASAPDRFTVDSPESADWALQRRSEVEAEVAKIDAQLRAVTENLKAKRNAALRRLSYWEYRFGPALVAFARSQLAGKSRTWQGAWGKVAFRKTPASHAIVDMAAAVEWMGVWAPGRVKVARSVAVRDVLAVKAEVEGANQEEERLPFVVASPPGEAVVISTGIEIGKGD
jgi:hypothetical protein